MESVCSPTPRTLGRRSWQRLGSRVLQRETGGSSYEVRLARTEEDVKAAQALRFLVFNLELGEGLEESYRTCRDEDPYDAVCDHLLVTCAGEVVGTYRLQTGTAASRNLGYYSESEFDLAPLEFFRAETVELGRACVAREHRKLPVLGMLWRGIAAYARERGGRYLIGCGSLTSQDESEGEALYRRLAVDHLAPEAWRIAPHPAFACDRAAVAEKTPKLPNLLSAYMSLGAVICGPPAIDRSFQTIDFLTQLDLEALAPEVRQYLL